jgi:hypothetical protein
MKTLYYRRCSRSLLRVNLFQSILNNDIFHRIAKNIIRPPPDFRKSMWLCYDSDSKISRMILVRCGRETYRIQTVLHRTKVCRLILQDCTLYTGTEYIVLSSICTECIQGRSSCRSLTVLKVETRLRKPSF